MDWEQYQKHKPFAGEKKPSMLRRRIGHDYESRCIYLITMTIEGRRPILGKLVGEVDAPDGSKETPRVELTPLGEKVRECWINIEHYHPQIRAVRLQIMPDHLHGILFVREKMDCHLGQVINGFKVGCNKAYRDLVLSVPSAAALSQQRQQGGTYIGQGGPVKLWAQGFNDHILSGRSELANWNRYLYENPRRLAIRRAYPDYFRVRFNVEVAKQSYAAIGNRFLLQHPYKVQVQLSRSLTDEQIKTEVERYLALASDGAILVSPAISKGEQTIMRAVLDARYPLVFLTPWGFNAFSKPGHQYYEACAAGRLLILAPWAHQNERLLLTRQMCLALNTMAQSLTSECTYDLLG